MANTGSISDSYPKWIVHGLWACGHTVRIDLGRFIAGGMADVPMLVRRYASACAALNLGGSSVGSLWGQLSVGMVSDIFDETELPAWHLPPPIPGNKV